MSTHSRQAAAHVRARRIHERLRDQRATAALPEIGGDAQCLHCGTAVPSVDVLYSAEGVACLVCYGEREVAETSITGWEDRATTLAGVAALVPFAIGLTWLSWTASFGPAATIAWMVMNLIPACAGLALVVLALRHLRDAYVNPLDEDLDRWSVIARASAGAVALAGSLGSTLALVVGALRPFFLAG